VVLGPHAAPPFKIGGAKPQSGGTGLQPRSFDKRGARGGSGDLVLARPIDYRLKQTVRVREK
jgi:hypothetical protein